MLFSLTVKRGRRFKQKIHKRWKGVLILPSGMRSSRRQERITKVNLKPEQWKEKGWTRWETEAGTYDDFLASGYSAVHTDWLWEALKNIIGEVKDCFWRRIKTFCVGRWRYKINKTLPTNPHSPPWPKAKKLGEQETERSNVRSHYKKNQPTQYREEPDTSTQRKIT